MNLTTIFLTGLTIGGLTCLAVQGGLLASVISTSKGNPLVSTTSFLVSKLVSYTILGVLLGTFGSMINIHPQVQTYMQLAAGIYMLAIAANLFDIHPIFRYVIIQPPRFLTRMVKDQSRSTHIFAPALLGVMTTFIPCGTTIAMEALAMSSSNPIQGGMIMFAFTLGTTPLFIGLGYLTTWMQQTFRDIFRIVASLALVYIGFTSIDGALLALGSPLNSSTLFAYEKPTAPPLSVIKVEQHPEIQITSSGYSPQYIRVKKGSPVTLTVKNTGSYGCASAFRIPSLGIEKNFKPNETETFSFIPTIPETITFTCAMGMYQGTIEVL